MKRYILALDEGTTSTRSILFDRNGKVVAKAQKEFTQFYPASGWVEEDARRNLRRTIRHHDGGGRRLRNFSR